MKKNRKNHSASQRILKVIFKNLEIWINFTIFFKYNQIKHNYDGFKCDYCIFKKFKFVLEIPENPNNFQNPLRIMPKI